MSGSGLGKVCRWAVLRAFAGLGGAASWSDPSGGLGLDADLSIVPGRTT